MKHAGTQEIHTERLFLRKILPDDAEVMFRNWANDAEVTRFMRWAAHKDADETRKTIQDWFDGYSNKTYHWGICIKGGEIIGSLGIFNVNESDGCAEMGYCIGRKWWGQKYTTEAVKAVIRYMFENTDIERIEAFHSVLNPASGKVMLNAGMRCEGFARHKYKAHGVFHDCDMYAIVREDLGEDLGALPQTPPL